MPYQVAEVERPLISVAQLTSAGHRVVLGETGGQIVHEKSGRTIELVRRGDIYLLMMTEGRPPSEAALGFPGRGSERLPWASIRRPRSVPFKTHS